MNRTAMLRRLEESPQTDFLIIGGGATGLGIAVDAESRGFQSVLLEAEDFAKGTSSRSTKLVHGGVRYLEQGDIPLVLEALKERGILHQNAPHIVHHLSFIVPRYKWWEGPFFGIGLKVYDALAGRLNLGSSKMLSREETLQRIPNVEPENLMGGVEYFDGQFDDARLAITLAQTATDLGGCLLNYAQVTALTKKDGLVNGVEFIDRLTQRTLRVEARVVINATGIFADQIRKLDDPQAIPSVQPSQGVHLVFSRDFLPSESAIMVPHTDDGRVLFVIPWHNRVVVGTTDTAMSEPQIEPRALDEEVEFILRNAARYLAKCPTRKDVLSIFAGQRPLVRPPGKSGGATKSISRNHEVFVSDSGLLTVVGGKWTTYRKMAEDALNHALQLSGHGHSPCVTEHLHLHGWRNARASKQEELLRVYGTDVFELEALYEENSQWREPLHPKLPYPKAVIPWAVRREMAFTVEDVLARRTRALILDAIAAAEVAPMVAEIMRVELGLSTAWATNQISIFQALAREYSLS